jgi:hypothetical protein
MMRIVIFLKCSWIQSFKMPKNEAVSRDEDGENFEEKLLGHRAII